MPDLTRKDIRSVLEHLQSEGVISRRELRRVTMRGGMFYGKPGTKEDRAIGNTIDRQEQPAFFERAYSEMRLPKSKRREVSRAFRSENVVRKLREIKRLEQQSKSQTQKPEEATEPMNPEDIPAEEVPRMEVPERKGFFQRFFMKK